jgi:hypothetical protein
MTAQCVIYYGLIPTVIIYHLIKDIDGWGQSPRGAGYLFGGDVVKMVPLPKY